MKHQDLFFVFGGHLVSKELLEYPEFSLSHNATL